MPKAYVSATFKDLKEHRRIAQIVLKRFGYDDVAMEYYVAEDQRSVDRCLSDVVDCDLYIGIFAWRYGWQPDGDLSITEMEYRRAVERNKPRLLFLVDDEAAWPMAFVDRDRTRVLELRERIAKDRMPAFFSTPDTLEARLSAALEQRTTHASVAIAFDTLGYFRVLRRRYGTLDLDALTDPKRDNFIPLHLASVFVEQNVKADAPAMELPKEMWQMLATRGELHPDDLPSAMAAEELAALRNAYVHNTAQPVLSTLSDPANRAVVILGDPGSGKSTLLRYILLTLIDAPAAPRLVPALTARIPILVELKAYAALRAHNKCDTLFEYFDAIANSESSPLTADAVRRLLASKQPVVVMFDGIDEIFQPAEQETITQQIVAFAEEFPEARVIATSRIIGYRRSLLTNAGFRHFTLQDLDEKQVTDFVTQWYTLTLGNRPDEAQQRVQRITSSFAASPSIRQLAGNPMLLTIMAIIGKHQALPRERWKLYDHAADVLVQHWDVHRHLAEPDLMDEEDKKELLRRLAYAMQSGEGGLAGNYIHSDMLQAEFEAYLRERYALPPDRTKRMAREMIAQFRERNFILSFYGAGLYGFVHRGFLEFFCATAIVDRFQKKKELSLPQLKEVFERHAEEKTWREVLRLVAGLIDEQFAAEIIDELLERKNVVLAVQCFSELRRLDAVPETALRVLQAVAREVSSDKSSPASREMLAASEIVGPRWPGREWLATFIASEVSAQSDYLHAFIASVGTGEASVARALIDALRKGAGIGKNNAAHALAAGFPTQETFQVLKESAMPFAIHASAQYLRHIDGVVDFIFENGDNSEGQNAIVQFFDNPRALPFLIRIVNESRGFLAPLALVRLSEHVHNPQARATLTRIAIGDDYMANFARDILARHPLATDPA